MLPLKPLDADTARAFARVFNDPTIAQAIDKHLRERKAELMTALKKSARMALIDERAKPIALQLQGQLSEIKSWLEALDRFLETGTVDFKKLRPKPLTA